MKITQEESMHFQDMNLMQQELFLYKVHKTINREFFDGKLNDVFITVGYGPHSENLENTAGVFVQKYYPWFCEAIEINDEFLGNLDEQRLKSGAKKQTQLEERLNLMVTMLHEMVHQYCYENSIDDTDHNENFQRIASKCGLNLKWISENEYTEQLDDRASLLLYILAGKIYYSRNSTKKMKRSYIRILKKFMPDDYIKEFNAAL